MLSKYDKFSDQMYKKDACKSNRCNYLFWSENLKFNKYFAYISVILT
jgi:hypothetical protein